MVNNNNDDTVQDDLEFTNDDTDNDSNPELDESEATAEQKLKALRKKLTEATEKNRELGEEMQRAKADFLNARRRLEEERLLDRKRALVQHAEKILPLADSFYLAMLDKTAWEKGDEKWRKGVEGIQQQLLGILRSYGIEAVDPTGTTFDPAKHEALTTIPVTDEALNHQVLTVMQLGYEMKDGEGTTVIRPARVTVGEYHTA